MCPHGGEITGCPADESYNAVNVADRGVRYVILICDYSAIFP
jgi:hypothetical protein